MRPRNHVVAAIIAFGTVGLVGSYVYYLRLPSSSFIDPHFVDGKSEFRPGDALCLKYTVQRLDTCRLEIARYLEDTFPDGSKETLIQSQTQLITPGPPRPSGFSPCPAVPLGTPPGRYKLFPRVQYYCNWTDYLKSRITNFPAVEITVVP